MITIRLLDNSSERYLQKTDTQCLGRRWDNIAEQIQVIKPVGEEHNVCAMLVYAEGKPVDRILVGNEPIDVTSLLSQFPSVEISFIFTNADGYVKNSEIRSYYFADARKPDDFVPMTPEQWTNIDVVMGGSFVRAKLQDNMIVFYNIENQEVGSVDLSGFSGGTGSSGGIAKEVDPTVPDYVKSITQTNIAEWNSRATVEYVDNQVEDIREVAEGKTKSFTVATLSELGSLFGINTSIISDEYSITKTNISYRGFNIQLNQGDLFLIVDTNVPDYWVSVDDMKIYKMETTKVDLADYVKNTDYATRDKGGVSRINPSFGVDVITTGVWAGALRNVPAQPDIIKNRTPFRNPQNTVNPNTSQPITSGNLDYAVKQALTNIPESGYVDSQGEYTDYRWTEEEKAKVLNLFGVPKFTATQLEDGSYSLSINTGV